MQDAGNHLAAAKRLSRTRNVIVLPDALAS